MKSRDALDKDVGVILNVIKANLKKGFQWKKKQNQVQEKTNKQVCKEEQKMKQHMVTV